jgi:hypothetical protein
MNGDRFKKETPFMIPEKSLLRSTFYDPDIDMSMHDLGCGGLGSTTHPADINGNNETKDVISHGIDQFMVVSTEDSTASNDIDEDEAILPIWDKPDSIIQGTLVNFAFYSGFLYMNFRCIWDRQACCLQQPTSCCHKRF